MKTHNLTQGTPEWYAYRNTHFNASDAPAMMGLSKYTTRNDLLKSTATGITPEIDYQTQKRFDDGHRFEALARPIAEAIIGSELYPVVGSSGKFSASFDGLTMAEDVNFEHKTLNAEIKACESIDDLDIMYKIQMTQQMGVSGSTKTLFLATKWDGETLVDKKEFWYEFDVSLWEKIINGWYQFEEDLKAYQHVEAKAVVKAESIQQLPVVTVQAKGELTLSNLDDVKPKFDLFLSSQKTQLVSDEDFANGESVAKFSREVADKLKITAQSVIDQMSDVRAVHAELLDYASKFDALGLKYEKLVKAEKENRKNQIIAKAKSIIDSYVADLEKEIQPVRLNVSGLNYAYSMNGKKTIEGSQNAIDQFIANTKISLSETARLVRANLSHLGEVAKEFKFLFADIGVIAFKEGPDFKLLVKSRIDEAVASQAKHDEEIKAKAEADALAKVDAPIVLSGSMKSVPNVVGIRKSVEPVEVDEITEFLNQRTWKTDKEKQTARAILVEFNKFLSTNQKVA